MLMSPRLAVQTLADLMGGDAVLVSGVELHPRKGQFIRHGYVLVGDVAVRAYKSKGRWAYDEREVRRAGHALARLEIDRRDLVEVRFPDLHAARDLGEAGWAAFWGRADWRRAVSGWMSSAAQQVHDARRSEVDAYADAEWVSRYRVGDNGLQAGVSMEDFVAYCRDRTVGCTSVADLLVRDKGRWMLPAAYVSLLDRWQCLDEELPDRARPCSKCQRRSPDSGPRWRTPTSQGYITLCPDCSRAGYPAYAGVLRGTPYASLRPAVRADAYLCRICTSTRASVWDHCHDHGLVRGPFSELPLRYVSLGPDRTSSVRQERFGS